LHYNIPLYKSLFKTKARKVVYLARENRQPKPHIAAFLFIQPTKNDGGL